MANGKRETNKQTSAPERTGLPTWDQLPDIGLYMDQVIALMTRYLGATADDGGKALTSSMVNNYVKTGLVPAPTKKRYGREHLAYLAIVCSLKSVLPLSSIRTLLDHELAKHPIEEFYEVFCAAVDATEQAAKNDYGTSDSPALHAALRARADRELAVAFYL